MCLAVPAEIEKTNGHNATVALDGSRSEISLALVPGAKTGDWVLVHAGYAIALLDPQTARETYDLLKEMDSLAQAKGEDSAGGQ